MRYCDIYIPQIIDTRYIDTERVSLVIRTEFSVFHIITLTIEESSNKLTLHFTQLGL